MTTAEVENSLRTIGKVIGTLLWVASGGLIFIGYFVTMGHWLGHLGYFLAFVLAPGLVIFPVVFWIVQGVFPVSYFVLLGLGIVGMLISAISD